MKAEEIAYSSREEWLSLRRGYIGGSDAGTIIGLNPYKSAYTLWAEKTGKMPEFDGNLTTAVGSYLEDFVAKLFESETGKKVRRKNRMLVNDEYPFACADVDRVVVGENAILECKTTNSLPAMKKFKNGEYPESWYCQMTHYLAVGGYDKAYLAVLIGCREFKVFELERDEGEIKALMEAEEEFWNNNVLKDIPPATDGAASTTDTISAIYPESNEELVSLMAYEKDIESYMSYSTLIKDLEKKKDEVANRIKAAMGESGKGESNAYKVSWISAERKSFDTKKFSAAHKDIDLSSFYKTSTYRTFKVTEIGK